MAKAQQTRFQAMYPSLIVGDGYRGSEMLNESMRKALKALDQGRANVETLFEFNLSLQAGLAQERRMTPVAYLNMVLPTYKYDKVRFAANSLLGSVHVMQASCSGDAEVTNSTGNPGASLPKTRVVCLMYGGHKKDVNLPMSMTVREILQKHRPKALSGKDVELVVGDCIQSTDLRVMDLPGSPVAPPPAVLADSTVAMPPSAATMVLPLPADVEDDLDPFSTAKLHESASERVVSRSVEISPDFVLKTDGGLAIPPGRPARGRGRDRKRGLNLCRDFSGGSVAPEGQAQACQRVCCRAQGDQLAEAPDCPAGAEGVGGGVLSALHQAVPEETVAVEIRQEEEW